MRPEPYSIKQVRLKTPDIRTQVRNLAICLNRKISETHKGMEADQTYTQTASKVLKKIHDHAPAPTYTGRPIACD